jgi:hypothetical protein
MPFLNARSLGCTERLPNRTEHFDCVLAIHTSARHERKCRRNVP